MLNPSKATERENDPTIERCQRRAALLGFEAIVILNIFAWRETDPAKLRLAKDPVGPENQDALTRACQSSDALFCAWGVHGSLLDQGPKAERFLREIGKPLHTLGLTKDGHPRHPLYVSYKTKLQQW